MKLYCYIFWIQDTSNVVFQRFHNFRGMASMSNGISTYRQHGSALNKYYLIILNSYTKWIILGKLHHDVPLFLPSGSFCLFWMPETCMFNGAAALTTEDF